jgi:hypothetical protein
MLRISMIKSLADKMSCVWIDGGQGQTLVRKNPRRAITPGGRRALRDAWWCRHRGELPLAMGGILLPDGDMVGCDCGRSNHGKLRTPCLLWLGAREEHGGVTRSEVEMLRARKRGDRPWRPIRRGEARPSDSISDIRVKSRCLSADLWGRPAEGQSRVREHGGRFFGTSMSSGGRWFGSPDPNCRGRAPWVLDWIRNNPLPTLAAKKGKSFGPDLALGWHHRMATSRWAWGRHPNNPPDVAFLPHRCCRVACADSALVSSSRNLFVHPPRDQRQWLSPGGMDRSFDPSERPSSPPPPFSPPHAVPSLPRHHGAAVYRRRNLAG